MSLFDWRWKRRSAAPGDGDGAPPAAPAPEGVAPLYSSLDAPRRARAAAEPREPYSETYSVTVTPAPARPAALLGAHEPLGPVAREDDDSTADEAVIVEPLARAAAAPTPTSRPAVVVATPATHAHASTRAPADEPASRALGAGHPQHGARALMRAAYDAADWDQALALGHHLLSRDAYDGEARACVEACAAHLLTDFTARLGRRERVLRRLAADDWLEGVVIDQRAARLLEEIDGRRSIDDVMARSGLPPLEAMGLLLDMIAEGVLEAAPRSW